MTDVTHRFDRSRNVSPLLLQPALAQHRHPSNSFEPRERKADWQEFQPVQYSAPECVPDHDHTEPAGEADHEKCGKETDEKELIGAWQCRAGVPHKVIY